MSRATTNSDRGLDAALERYQERLTTYAFHILRDEERARDVVQDTYLELCSQDRSAMIGRLQAWLYTVCRNRALDVLRKEKRMPLAEAAPHMTRDDAPPVEHRDELMSVLAQLDRLPPNQQEVVRLKFQQGLSYREIAEIAGLSVSNVGFLIHSAVKALRSRLAVGSVELTRRTS